MLANRLLANSILIIMRTEVLVSVPYAIRALSHSTTTWMLLCRAMNMRSSYPLPKLSDIMVLNRSFSLWLLPPTKAYEWLIMTPKAQMSQINARLFSCPTAMVYIGADVTHLCIFVLSISDEWAKYGATVYVVPKTVVDTVLPLVLALCLMCSSSCWCYF